MVKIQYYGEILLWRGIVVVGNRGIPVSSECRVGAVGDELCDLALSREGVFAKGTETVGWREETL